MAKAGWARPISNYPTHWWRPDGHKACEPTSGDYYIGPKLDESELKVIDVCTDCLGNVSAARNVVGRDGQT